MLSAYDAVLKEMLTDDFMRSYHGIDDYGTTVVSNGDSIALKISPTTYDHSRGMHFWKVIEIDETQDTAALVASMERQAIGLALYARRKYRHTPRCYA